MADNYSSKSRNTFQQNFTEPNCMQYILCLIAKDQINFYALKTHIEGTYQFLGFHVVSLVFEFVRT